MTRTAFFLPLLLSTFNHGLGQMGSTTDDEMVDCWGRFEDIVDNEILVRNDTSEIFVYELCADTVFAPGVIGPNFGLLFGDSPLTLKPNAHVRCGPDGSVANNCTMDGGGTFGIYTIPHTFFFQDEPEKILTSIGTIIFEGLTISGWAFPSQQVPILIAGNDGEVKFKDCIFSDNIADPLFALLEVDFELSPDELPAQRSLANFNTSDGDSRRLPYDYSYGYNLVHNNRRDWTENNLFINSTNLDRRRLQGETTGGGGVNFVFESCTFSDNDAFRRTQSVPGLSLVSLRRSNAVNAGMNDQPTTQNAQFIFRKNKFINNNFNIEGDQMPFRAIIDHYGIGPLILENNCFIDTTAKTYGMVFKQAQAKLTNKNNFVNEVQTDLECPFIANIDSQYKLTRCGGKAKATECGADDVAPVGGGGFFACFPADATCEVEGVGKVLMKDISLGDKVLVDFNKYEPVYSFGHYNPLMEAEFLRISTDSHKLDISGDHMVFLEGGESMPAKHVKIDDMLQLAGSGSEIVMRVENIKKRGVYAPFTASGSIIINGIKASTFIAFQDSKTLILSGMDTGISFQFIAHTFELPHRVWCEYISECLEEQYTDDGVSTWVAFPHTLAIWFLEQNDFFMAVLAVPFLISLGILGNFYHVGVITFLVGTLAYFRSKISFHVKLG